MHSLPRSCDGNLGSTPRPLQRSVAMPSPASEDASAPAAAPEAGPAPQRAAAEGDERVRISCVVLTMGNRPAELRRAIDSVFEQRDADVDVIVVGNGADLPELPDGVATLRLPENVGIPEGRNQGVAATDGDIILFLDDDGWYRSPDLAKHVADRFAADPTLGALSFRIADPDGGPDQRRDR